MLTVLGSIGITIILTQSKLFKWLQSLGHFFKCSMCMGFWVGGFVYLLTEFIPPDYRFILSGFLLGGMVSLFSYTWNLLMRYFMDKYDNDESK